jgi:hypothetical protein
MRKRRLRLGLAQVLDGDNHGSNEILLGGSPLATAKSTWTEETAS